MPSAAYPQKTYLSAQADNDYENRNKVATINQNMYIAHQLTNKCDVMSRSIRDIFSSTTKGAALGAMILGSVASPITASANDADAEIHPGVTASSVTMSASARAAYELAQAQKEIGVNDSRKFDKQVIRTYTARASNDRIAVAIYGADNDMLNQVRLAAYQAKQRGVDIVGIVVGPTNETKSFDVYADGQRTTTDFDLDDAMPNGMTMQRLAEYTINDAHDFLQEVLAKESRQVADASAISLEQN